jgi:hypothetical protein
MSQSINDYYHWLSILVTMKTLLSEGIIEEDTYTEVEDHLMKIKYLIDGED